MRDAANILWRNRTLCEGNADATQLLDGPASLRASLDVVEGDSAGVAARARFRAAVLRGLGPEFAEDVTSRLSITAGSCAGFARTFLFEKKRLVTGAGRDLVLQRSMIRGQWRVAYVDFLRDHGLVGLHSFLHTFISSLKKGTT